MLLYQAIRQYLLDLIAADKIGMNGKLPSERELQAHFSSTRITVREALARLESEGIIYRLNRKGWFISPPRLLWNPAKKVNFNQLAAEQGFSFKTLLVNAHQLKQSEFNSDATLAAQALATDGDLIELQRVRYLSGRPVLLELIYCREQQFPQLAQQELEGSLTKVQAEHYGVVVSYEKSAMHVTSLSDVFAEHLQLNSGSACMQIIRRRFDKQDQLIDFNIEYWVHGAIELVIESNE